MPALARLYAAAAEIGDVDTDYKSGRSPRSPLNLTVFQWKLPVSAELKFPPARRLERHGDFNLQLATLILQRLDT